MTVFGRDLAMRDIYRIAVIGMGPRGLGALEALADRMPARGPRIQVDVYDTLVPLGVGPNFDPAESPLCKLNIPVRDIDIAPPAFSGIGSFTDFQESGLEPDDFPTRAEMGRYLAARYQDLVDRKVLEIVHQRARITAIEQTPSGWTVQTSDRTSPDYSEVLLTLGQPAVQPDPQLNEWQHHARGTSATLADAYPARALVKAAADWQGLTVAIRGLALSAFDILRSLTVGQGGEFTGTTYHPSGREPAQIIPFSLDGKPPYPKPETQHLDAQFDLSAVETHAFSAALHSATQSDPDEAARLITEALCTPVARILGTAPSAISSWLDTEWSDPGTQEQASPIDTLIHGIEMATGARPASVGYAIGQVWRKLQTPLRVGFNPAQMRPDTAEKLVNFDEGLKRYSYGPPVASARELLALITAGIVRLDYAADPTIELCQNGWIIKNGKAHRRATVMIDGVMPSPDPAQVQAPLIKTLVNDRRITPVSEALAAQITADGTLVAEDGSRLLGLSMLGRLALGSVIAADSLHDCFGAAAGRWAEGVLDRRQVRTP